MSGTSERDPRFNPACASCASLAAKLQRLENLALLTESVSKLSARDIESVLTLAGQFSAKSAQVIRRGVE